MSRRSIVALAALTMLATAVLPRAKASAATGLTFRVGVLQGTAGLDIANDASALASEIWTLQYPRLTEYDTNDLSPVPGVADSWSPSPDHLTYTYHLRGNLTWSDGTPVTPADVVASINNARTQHWPGTAGVLTNITARVAGARSVAVHTTRLDQRLPLMPVHIVPHGTTNLAVGSGP